MENLGARLNLKEMQQFRVNNITPKQEEKGSGLSVSPAAFVDDCTLAYVSRSSMLIGEVQLGKHQRMIFLNTLFYGDA